MGVFSYLKDLLGKEPESSNEDVYVVDPEFEESKDKGDTGQNSSGDSTDGESEKGSEVDSVKDHSQPRETASTEPEGLIKGKGTLAHLLEEEKRSGSSAAPRVGEEEIAHSFAAEDLAEDSEDGFEVPESGVSESEDSRREGSGSWGEQSRGSAAARVESGAEGVNGTPRAAVGDEDAVDTDSDEGVVLRIEDDSDGSAEGEVVVPEGSGSPVVESEGVVDGSGAVEDVDSVVKSVGVTGGLGRVEGPVVKSEGETVGVEGSGSVTEEPVGEGSSSESAEVEGSVVESVDEAGDTDPAAEEPVGGVSSSEDVEVEAPVGKTEDETGGVEGAEPVVEGSVGEDSSSERVGDLVIRPVSGTVEPERVDDLEVKSEDETESERVDDLEVKSEDETESEPVVAGDSEAALTSEDGMDLVLESDESRVETADEDKTSSLSLDGGERSGGLGNEESADLDAVVAENNENFESLEVENTHSPVVEETRSPAVDVEETHSPVVEDAVEPGAGDIVSGGGVVSDGEQTLDVRSEGQTLDLDVDDSAAEPSEGASVADGSYGSMSVVPWSVYMARQSEEVDAAVGEGQESPAAEDLTDADQSDVEEPAPIVESENDADSVDQGDERLIVADEESENDANSVDQGDEQLIVADEEPVEATVAPGLSLDEESGVDSVEDQDHDDVSFVADSDEDTSSETVDEDSDESVGEPADLLDEDEGGEFIEAEDSDEDEEGSSSVVKSELEVDPSLIEGSDESDVKKGESDGGLHISIPGF